MVKFNKRSCSYHITALHLLQAFGPWQTIHRLWICTICQPTEINTHRGFTHKVVLHDWFPPIGHCTPTLYFYCQLLVNIKIATNGTTEWTIATNMWMSQNRVLPFGRRNHFYWSFFKNHFYWNYVIMCLIW